jgi:hypothetical protein
MPEAERFALTRPDGIAQGHIEPGHRLQRHSSILSLCLLGALLALALTGWLGASTRNERIESAAAQVELSVPKVLRSGSFSQTQIKVHARQDIAELVLAFEPSLWREVTTNSIVPTPAEETHADGLLRFSFDSLDAGGSFELQIQQQVNPSRFGMNRGRFVLLDGEQPLMELPLSYLVLP